MPIKIMGEVCVDNIRQNDTNDSNVTQNDCHSPVSNVTFNINVPNTCTGDYYYYLSEMSLNADHCRLIDIERN